MEIFKMLQLNIYAFVILLVIFINERKQKKQVYENRIFIDLIKLSFLLLFIDSMAWFYNDRPGMINLILNWVFNTLLYVTALIPALLWVVYTDYQVYHKTERLKRIKVGLTVIFLFNAAMTFISFKTGWYFYIDSANIYHRGNLFWLHILPSYLLLVYTTAMIFDNRKKIDADYFKALLVFPLPILIGSMVQAISYGIILNWPSMVISLLILYLNIKNLGLSTDYLTGAFNRRQFDYYLKKKIRNSKKSKVFSAILIDLDKFKRINDTLGHHKGDEALLDVVKLIQRCLRSSDFVFRYGGDEFFIILNNTDFKRLLEVVNKIKKAVERFNLEGKKAYKLDFSMGYDVYSSNSKMKAEEFLKHIDELMYKHKRDKMR